MGTKWIKWTPKQEQLWAEWVAERPPVIQEMVAKHNLRLDNMYRLKSTGHRVILHSLDEDKTVKVHVLYKFNPDTMLGEFMDRTVFGIDPADLKVCEWDGKVEDGAPYEDLDDEKTLH